MTQASPCGWRGSWALCEEDGSDCPCHSGRKYREPQSHPALPWVDAEGAPLKDGSSRKVPSAQAQTQGRWARSQHPGESQHPGRGGGCGKGPQIGFECAPERLLLPERLPRGSSRPRPGQPPWVPTPHLCQDIRGGSWEEDQVLPAAPASGGPGDQAHTGLTCSIP